MSRRWAAYCFAKVVDKVAGGKNIHCRQVVCACRVIMIAMYGKDRQPYVEVGILKVYAPARYAVGATFALLLAFASRQVDALLALCFVLTILSLKDCNILPTGKVLSLVAEDLKLDRLVTQSVSCEDVNSSHNGAARWLVVMK